MRSALNGLPVTASGRDLLGTGAPWFEGWLEHPDVTDPFWAPLQCGAALQRTTVPTLLVGGWQDLFLAQTLEQYRVLSGRGVPTRLLVGPSTRLDVGAKGGVPVAESLAWLDRYLGPAAQAGGSRPGSRELRAAACGRPRRARLARRLRLASGGSDQQRWHLGRHGSLSPQPVASPGPHLVPP